MTNFIKKAVDNLDKHINLYGYDLVVILSKPMDKKICSMIRQHNVLVIDDVTKSAYTLNEVLRTLRIVNNANHITIFSLIGRKDLMADSF